MKRTTPYRFPVFAAAILLFSFQLKALQSDICAVAIGKISRLDQIINRHKIMIREAVDPVESLASGKTRPRPSKEMGDYKKLPLEIRNRLGLMLEDLDFLILRNAKLAFTANENKKSTGYFETKGLDIALRNLSNKDYARLFDPLFDGLGPNELLALYRGINLGLIEASPEQAALVKDLVHMTLDYGSIFWSGPEKVDHALNTENFNILDVKKTVNEALNRAERDWTLAQDPETQSQFIHRGLQLSLLNLLSRALKYKRSVDEGTQKPGNPPSLFEKNPHQVVVAVISEAQQSTQHAQLAVMMDEPVSHALANLADKYKLNNAEITKLNSMLNDTEGQLLEASENIGTLFGVSGKTPTLSTPIHEGEINLHEIEFNAGKANAQKDLETLAEQGLKDMETLERVLQAAAKRSGQAPPKMEEMHSVYLQMLSKKHRQESLELSRQYQKLLNNPNRVPKNALLDSEVTWMAHYKYDEFIDGVNTEKTGTLETKVPLKRSITYEEILSGTIDPGTAPHFEIPKHLEEVKNFRFEGDAIPRLNPKARKDANNYIERAPEYILKMSQEVRRREAPGRKALKALDEHFSGLNKKTYEAIVSVDARRTDYIHELETAQENLKTLIDELKSYSSMTKDEIMANWEFDVPRHFHERNKMNLTRLEMMSKRVELLRAMLVNKVPQLELEFRDIDMGEDTLILQRPGPRRRLTRARNQTQRALSENIQNWGRTQTIIGSSLGVLGMGGIAYWMLSPDSIGYEENTNAGIFESEKEIIDYEEFKAPLKTLNKELKETPKAP